MRYPAHSPLGVCVLPESPRNAGRAAEYPGTINEVFAHAGVPIHFLALEDWEVVLPDLRLLVTVGDAVLDEDRKRLLTDWVTGGGGWIAIAGTCGLEGLLGVEVEYPAFISWGGSGSSLGEGYLHPVGDHLPDRIGTAPLHFFNGVPVSARGGTVHARVLDSHGRETNRIAVVETTPDRGHCFLIAPDVTGAILRVQQGRAVTRDGIPAPDGSAPLADGVLKSDDGAVLDWTYDRREVEGAPGFRAFLDPVADRWRDLLLSTILDLVKSRNVPLPILWYYPHRLPALGHLSHDTDGHEPEKARRLLTILESVDVTSTWCVLAPGYPSELIKEIRRAGHETAMHYDAMSDGLAWSESSFAEQYDAISGLFEGDAPVTNKNHYLRWEGDVDLLLWSERRGIRIDQSKGASKTGESGYGFGTCHPYWLFDSNGRRIEVMEMATPTQDLEVFAPRVLLDSLLETVMRHHGILHLLFHPAHIERPEVEAALRGAVRKGRKAGLAWWTAKAIHEWEMARRDVAWSDYTIGSGGISLSIVTRTPLHGATLLWPVGDRDGVECVIRVNGTPLTVEQRKVWGHSFYSVVADLKGVSELQFDDGG